MFRLWGFDNTYKVFRSYLIKKQFDYSKVYDLNWSFLSQSRLNPKIYREMIVGLFEQLKSLEKTNVLFERNISDLCDEHVRKNKRISQFQEDLKASEKIISDLNENNNLLTKANTYYLREIKDYEVRFRDGTAQNKRLLEGNADHYKKINQLEGNLKALQVENEILKATLEKKTKSQFKKDNKPWNKEVEDKLRWRA